MLHRKKKSSPWKRISETWKSWQSTLAHVSGLPLSLNVRSRKRWKTRSDVACGMSLLLGNLQSKARTTLTGHVPPH